MAFFNRKRNKSEELEAQKKFEAEKRKQAAMFILRIYRSNKLKIPDTAIGKIVLEHSDKIDPEHKLSERDLLDKLIQSDEVSNALSIAMSNDELVSDEVIKSYSETYYKSMRDVLSSPEPSALDMYEYQSQQLITVLSLKSMDLFKTRLKELMDNDPTCPFFVKKTLIDLLLGPKCLPTQEDEKTAEKIIKLTCPSISKSNPEVFRALVDSLKWRGSYELKKTLEDVRNTPKDKRHIRGRESCIFIETKDTVHYVG